MYINVKYERPIDIWLLQNGEMPQRSSSASSPQLSQVSIRNKITIFLDC